MRIYLITHAHTEQSTGVAADAWRLSTKGKQQAAKLAGASFWDQVNHVVVSSEAKTWLTVAGVVDARRLPVWIDCRFDELRRGDWTDHYAAQVAEVFAQPTQSIRGWESAESVRSRVSSGLSDLQVRFAGATLALVGHGLCLTLLRSELLGRTHADFSAWQRLGFASYATICLDPPSIVEEFPLGEPVR